MRPAHPDILDSDTTMHSNFMLRLSPIVLPFFLIASEGRADYIFTFDRTNYEVAPGETVDVEVSLTQITPVPSDISLDGITDVGVRVFFNDSPPLDPARVFSIDDIIINPLFDNNDALVGNQKDLDSGVSAGFLGAIDFGSPALTGDSIVLGSFRFTAGNSVGEVTNLLVTDFSSADETFANDPTISVLDSFISSSTATITVSAVPEPGSITLIVMASVLTVMIRGNRNA